MMENLQYYFVTKAPFQLPAGLKEFIVKFGPWLSLIILIISIPMILALVGLNANLAVYAGRYDSGWSLSSVLYLVALALQAMALPGLFRRKLSGWNLAFYGMLVSSLSSLVMGNILGVIIGLIIGLYILFQIRSYYS